MLLGGLWHGAGWTFVVWGGIHGAALVAERWWREPARLRRAAVDGLASRLAALRHLPRRLLRLDLLPLRLVRGRVGLIVRLFTAWGEPSELVTGGVLLAIAIGIGSQYLRAACRSRSMARFSRLPGSRTGGRRSRSRCSSSTRSGPRASPPSSTSSSEMATRPHQETTPPPQPDRRGWAPPALGGLGHRRLRARPADQRRALTRRACTSRRRSSPRDGSATSRSPSPSRSSR